MQDESKFRELVLQSYTPPQNLVDRALAILDADKVGGVSTPSPSPPAIRCQEREAVFLVLLFCCVHSVMKRRSDLRKSKPTSQRQ